MASGNGTNAEAIMRYFQNHPQVSVALILSNKADAQVLQRAVRFGVPTRSFNREQFDEPGGVLTWLEKEGITHLVLAGFLWLIPASLIHRYPEKILNIHPALLPSHGGKGMYGDKVHQAVKASGATKTGITIHLVNESFDEGKIIFQASCPVNSTDTPETIAVKVHRLEHEHYPKIIEEWVIGGQ